MKIIGPDDRVRSGEKAIALLRRADGKERVITKRWHTGLARRAVRFFLALVLTPIVLPVAIFILIFRRDRHEQD